MTAGRAVIILAAGRGTRMGSPKALMQVRDRPWWCRQAARLEHAGVHAIWVVSPEVRTSMEAAPHQRPRHLVIADPDAPMFGSIFAGLSTLRDSLPHPAVVFILPVDVPAPEPATFDALARATTPPTPTTPTTPATPVIPAHHAERGHPICLPWAWIVQHLSDDRLASLPPDRRRLDRLTAPHAVTIDVDDPAVTWNLNEPRDLEAWLARHG